MFIDMMWREVAVRYPPKRIISLVPSQTELLYDLGLSEEVIGITKFCVHPHEWFRNKQRVGGTKNLNLEAIKALSPDLIIANKEENTQDQIEALAKEFPVWISDIDTFDEALTMITAIGALVNKESESITMRNNIERSFERLIIPSQPTPLRVAYFIWYQPWMGVGSNTFVHSMLEKLSWINVLADDCRYPEIDISKLKTVSPDWLLLSSEPFPFNEQHAVELQQLLPQAKIAFVDGEMFSWYGSRLQKALAYFQQLLQDLK